MPTLSPSDLLLVWERAMCQPPLERRLTMLAAVDPDRELTKVLHLSVGQFDAELLALREETFGRQVEGVADCAACGETLELSFDTTEFERGQVQGNGPHAVQCDGGEVLFRLPTAADLAAVAEDGDIACVRKSLLERCAATPPAADLSAAACRAVVARMAELDPLADIRLELSCPACGATGHAFFDVGEFFWAEIEAAAWGTLEDVHVLASAYGWREADVLGLSPERRRLYVELAG